MPTFNFSVVDVVKKKVPQKVKSNDTYKVIQKKVVGIVHVDIDANYYVIVDNLNDLNILKTYPKK